MENGANSTLFIAKVRKTDTGNYTCSIGPNDFHTINVQVLNGNSLLLPFFRYIHCFEYFGSEKQAEGFIIPFQYHFSPFFTCRIHSFYHSLIIIIPKFFIT